MTEIITSILPYAAGLVGLIGLFFGIHINGKRMGKRELERDIDKARIGNLKKAKGAQDEINNLDDDAVRQRAIDRLRESRGE